MGKSINLKDVVYYALDENGQPIGEGHPMGEAIAVEMEPVETVGDTNIYDFNHFGISGTMTIDLPRKNSKEYDWFKYLLYHHYTENIVFNLGHLFKDVRIMDNVALWNMAEGLYKLDQVRKQKNSRGWDSVRQYFRK
jgi:hypothetical protein